MNRILLLTLTLVPLMLLDCRRKKTPDPVAADCCSGIPISLIDGKDAIWLPNAFTPNGDLFNDTYEIYGESIATLTVQVKKNASIVYESRALRFSWDGKRSNKVYDNDNFQLQVSGTFISGKAFSFTGCISLISNCSLVTFKSCVLGDQLTSRGLTGSRTLDPCAVQ